MESIRHRRVFVDSSAYLALLDRQDNNHSQATAVVRWLAAERFRQITTNVLVIETHSLLLSRMGLRQASQFLHEIDASNTVIVRARFADEEYAKKIVFRYQDKDFSLADAISFAVMERLGLARAFAFDRHFAQYGFSVLAPDVHPRNW
ncbi:MAG: type II toxin-antitoxin system VapC family toxin [Chloroflexi bacterium]|nr:type II toxin-antitoxin system VapC family toxin [Chloroflexota bacterium]